MRIPAHPDAGAKAEVPMHIGIAGLLSLPITADRGYRVRREYATTWVLLPYFP
jgi:hypothetical protein